jgi:uncharacterized membrane protein YdbT with pleckstrin-like domain
MLIVSLILGLVALRFEAGSVLRTAIGWVALLMIAYSTVWTILRYISWATSHFVVTNRRVMYRSGWLSKTGMDIPLDRINNVIISRNMFERLFGAGDLLIESAGVTGQQRFSDIRSPTAVQNQIFEQIQLDRQAVNQPAVVVDVAGQLERLEGMYRRGTLTAEEFEAQKRRLLGS